MTSKKIGTRWHEVEKVNASAVVKEFWQAIYSGLRWAMESGGGLRRDTEEVWNAVTIPILWTEVALGAGVER